MQRMVFIKTQGQTKDLSKVLYLQEQNKEVLRVNEVKIFFPKA